MTEVTKEALELAERDFNRLIGSMPRKDFDVILRFTNQLNQKIDALQSDLSKARKLCGEAADKLVREADYSKVRYLVDRLRKASTHAYPVDTHRYQ